MQLIIKSFGASILISLGCYVLLKIGTPIGPFLFSLGLLSICYLNMNLFTGKCGFFIEDKIPIKKIIQILCVNIIAGICAGVFIRLADPSLIELAQNKVNNWSISISFFIQSVFCGIIMFIAVAMYRKGSVLGILLGVPLFIFCGMQHSIANSVFYGIAGFGNWIPIWLCALGNWIGAIIMWLFYKEGKNESRIN